MDYEIPAGIPDLPPAQAKPRTARLRNLPAKRAPRVAEMIGDGSRLSDDALLKLIDLLRLRILPLSMGMARELITQGEFVKPMRLGPKLVVYRLGDVKAWLKARAAHFEGLA